MNRKFYTTALFLLSISMAMQAQLPNKKPGSPALAADQETGTLSRNPRRPPRTAQTSPPYTMHGQTIEDPYSWLEQPAEVPDVKRWIQLQQSYTEHVLGSQMYREAIRLILKEKWNYPKTGVPQRKGKRLYYAYNPGLLNQFQLWSRAEDGEETLVLDPNKFSEDGTSSLATWSISKDGKLLAYAISDAGSDWRTIRVLNLETGQTLNDVVSNVKFSEISWLGNGFFYSRFPRNESGALINENAGQQVCYHQLGTDSQTDQVIFEDRQNPKFGNYAYTVANEKLLVISQTRGTHGNRIWVSPVENGKPSSKRIPIISDYDSESAVVWFDGENVYLHTNRNAPTYRLVKIPLNKPQEKNWTDVIKASDAVLQSVSYIPNGWAALYMRDVKNEITLHWNNNRPQAVQLPAMGTISGMNVDEETGEIFFAITSFHMPGSIYRIAPGSHIPELYKASELNINSSAYEVKQVKYASKDGTMIPMYLFYRKDLELTNRPCLLYGYGGFNIPVMPAFSLVNWLFVESGGVYAVPALRGGGEFGEEWHKAGMLSKKQNVFDDFIAAAEYLIQNQITSSQKLAIHGRSNGGLLVGACMTQRPDLFRVAIPAVGVLDMLKFHKFTIGHAWMVEYGNPDHEEDFKWLIKYSPLHNIKPGTSYPATMVMTADHDDRVVPAHSFKFAAALQNANRSRNPILIRIDSNAGHGAGKSTEMIINEYADFLTFLFSQFGQ